MERCRIPTLSLLGCQRLEPITSGPTSRKFPLPSVATNKDWLNGGA